MAKKTTTKTTSSRAKTKTSPKRPAAKRASVKAAASVSQKVDYYPNRVAFLTAVTAVVLITCFAIVVVSLEY